MLLYVNGDISVIAPMAVNNYIIAKDDPLLFYLNDQPHPDNKNVSWARKVSDSLKTLLNLNTETNVNNVIRDSTLWLTENKQTVFVIIGWKLDDTEHNQFHDSIWNFHQWLDDRYIGHLFFNINLCFNNVNQFNWHNKYLEPYNQNKTYNTSLLVNHYPVDDNNLYFDAVAHTEWANILLKYIRANKLL